MQLPDKQSLRIIGFDADDTLWINEPYFQETEKRFCEILSNQISEKECSAELFKTEMQNLEIYGYGVKSFLLSMIETALRISQQTIDPCDIEKIIDLGKDLINRPVSILEGVSEVLSTLSQHFLLVLATKGDLLDQERKLERSGLGKYFHHIEIMSEKNPENYEKLFRHLNCEPKEFLMVGNSLKSDILPVCELGGQAVHVPFEVMWLHEKVAPPQGHIRYYTIQNIQELTDLVI